MLESKRLIAGSLASLWPGSARAGMKLESWLAATPRTNDLDQTARSKSPKPLAAPDPVAHRPDLDVGPPSTSTASQPNPSRGRITSANQVGDPKVAASREARAASESAGTRRSRLAPKLRGADPPGPRFSRRPSRPRARHAGRPCPARIAVDGEPIRLESMVYYAVNKPKGYVSTNFDPAGRPRVVDLLPEIPERVYTVGRLDEESTGLMILTNDGELANRLAHPRYGVEKLYRALVAGCPDHEILAKLTEGIWLSEGKVRAKRARIVGRQGQATVLELVLAEGKNREIRRMLAKLGHKVMSLNRVAVGPISLKGLSSGECRPLSRHEVDLLRKVATASPCRCLDSSTASLASRRPRDPHRPPPGRPRTGPGETTPAQDKIAAPTSLVNAILVTARNKLGRRCHLVMIKPDRSGHDRRMQRPGKIPPPQSAQGRKPPDRRRSGPPIGHGQPEDVAKPATGANAFADLSTGKTPHHRLGAGAAGRARPASHRKGGRKRPHQETPIRPRARPETTDRSFPAPWF